MDKDVNLIAIVDLSTITTQDIILRKYTYLLKFAKSKITQNKNHYIILYATNYLTAMNNKLFRTPNLCKYVSNCSFAGTSECLHLINGCLLINQSNQDVKLK